MRKKLIRALIICCIIFAPVLSTQAAWNVDGAGWWYSYEDGGYAVNQWEQINGTWYYFDEAGYMQTGWQFIDGAWYYMDGSGAMLTGWQVIDGSWYYLNGSGAMAANQWIGNYYVDGSGRMATNTWIGNYYVGGDGAWIPGYGAAQWIQDGNGWWYRHGDGGYTTNGWKQINGAWYLFDRYGYMQTGWQYLGNTWYFLHENGTMASDQWIGNYYLYPNGSMATNTTIHGYYVGNDGQWIPQIYPENILGYHPRHTSFLSTLDNIRKGINSFHFDSLKEAKETFGDCLDYSGMGIVYFYHSHDEYYFSTDDFGLLQESLKQTDAKYQEYRDYIVCALSTMNLNGSESEIINQIKDFVIENFSYKIQEIPMWDFVKIGEGKCWHYSILFWDMCRAVAIDCDYVANENHAWNVVTVDGTNYVFDLSGADLYGESGYLWK